MSHILLIGFMGSGKSSAGRLLATRLERPFVDLDARIESRAGMSVSEVFATRGEDAFRQLEHDELVSLAQEAPSVVACGGGAVVRDDNRALLQRLGIVIYLRVSAGEALARIGDTATRPLLAGQAGPLAATRLLEARETLYSAVADHAVDTEGLTVADVVESVLTVLAREGA